MAPKDGGYRSRKMVMAYIAMLLICLAFAAVGKWESLRPVYPELIMGILGATTIFTGGNVVTKFANNLRKVKPVSKSSPDKAPK